MRTALTGSWAGCHGRSDDWPIRNVVVVVVVRKFERFRWMIRIRMLLLLLQMVMVVLVAALVQLMLDVLVGIVQGLRWLDVVGQGVRVAVEDQRVGRTSAIGGRR